MLTVRILFSYILVILSSCQKGNGDPVVETEFKFKTMLMKVMGNLMKKNYVKRTERDMQRFKEMVENL